MILSDTPELSNQHEMQESMMNFVKSALNDVLIYMVEMGNKVERRSVLQ
jgi:GTPase Era involved in 16S rRNA processing